MKLCVTDDKTYRNPWEGIRHCGLEDRSWKQCQNWKSPGNNVVQLFCPFSNSTPFYRWGDWDSEGWAHLPGVTEWMSGRAVVERMKMGGSSQKMVDQRQEWWSNSSRTVSTGGMLTRHHHCVNHYIWIILFSYMQHLCEVSCRLWKFVFFFFFNLVIQNLNTVLMFEESVAFWGGQWLFCRSWKCQMRSRKKYSQSWQSLEPDNLGFNPSSAYTSWVPWSSYSALLHLNFLTSENWVDITVCIEALWWSSELIYGNTEKCLAHSKCSINDSYYYRIYFPSCPSSYSMDPWPMHQSDTFTSHADKKKQGLPNINPF